MRGAHENAEVRKNSNAASGVYSRTYKKDSSILKLVWLFINSSIFLWLLTATFGSLATFTYSNLQTCFKEADQKIDRINHLASEIQSRRTAIIRAINTSSSAPELKYYFGKIRASRDEYKDRTIGSLEEDLREAVKSVQDEPGIAMVGASGWNPAFGDHPAQDLFNGIVPDNLRELNSDSLKEPFSWFSRLGRQDIIWSDKWRAAPNCTVRTAFLELWRAPAPRVRYVQRETTSPD